MGTIALQIEIGELYSDALFHSFKFLINGEVKTVLADTDPFKGEQVNYVDAKFYKQSKVTFSQPIKDEVVQKESQSPAVEKAKPSRLVKIKSSKTPKS
ncbi:hypothetical protein ACFX16_031704 [Malus domestica]